MSFISNPIPDIVRGFFPDTNTIRYCVKLNTINARQDNTPNKSRFQNLMSGIGNTINSTISSMVTDNYLVGTADGNIVYVSDKQSPEYFAAANILSNILLKSGEIVFNIMLPSGTLHSASVKLTQALLESAVYGSVTEFLKDFDSRKLLHTENMTACYSSVRVSCASKNAEKPYELKTESMFESLISYDSEAIYINNSGVIINFSNILLLHESNERYALIVSQNNGLAFYEIFRNSISKPAELQFNLAEYETADTVIDPCITINFPESIARASSFICIYSYFNFDMLAVDDSLYMPSCNTINKCGLFADNSTLYAKCGSSFTKYSNMSPIISSLRLLPQKTDTVFLENSEAQPCISDDTEHYVTLCDEGLKLDGETHMFSEISNFKYAANDMNCIISYTINNTAITFMTAYSFGIHISKSYDQISTSSKISEFSINQLYDEYYKRCSKIFLAQTFSELLKTNHSLNENNTVEETLTAILATESDVLRNYASSFMGKFKNIDDLQEQLMSKLTILEIQRKKISKIMDEWAFIYPHYAAQARVDRLKKIFGGYVTADEMRNIYWKTVSQFKAILSPVNMQIQKVLGEIGSCSSHYSAAFSDDVRRTDITGALRVSSRSTEGKLEAGVNIALAASAGLELTNVLLRVSKFNPITVAASAKMMVDSYVKDANLRKNIKSFGCQALEWWQILMKRLGICFLELSKSYNDYNKQCLAEDKTFIARLPQEKLDTAKKLISDDLKKRISKNIDDKYTELSNNLRIDNLLEGISVHSDSFGEIINEFDTNLIV